MIANSGVTILIWNALPSTASAIAENVVALAASNANKAGLVRRCDW